MLSLTQLRPKIAHYYSSYYSYEFGSYISFQVLTFIKYIVLSLLFLFKKNTFI